MGDKVTTVTVSAVVYGAVVLCSAVCVAALGVEAFQTSALYGLDQPLNIDDDSSFLAGEDFGEG